MPQIVGTVTEDSGSKTTFYSGMFNTVSQNYSFPVEQNGMQFRNKGDTIATLTVDGVVYKVPPYGTVDVDDQNFTSFDVSALTGSHLFEITAFAKKNNAQVNSAELNEIKSELAQKATKAEIASIGNASPKGVYATLTALQTAFPTGTTGVYLVTADGKWYYWNGSAWTEGGTYQASALFPATNIVANADFSNGTTNWTTGGSTLSLINGVLVITGSGSNDSPRAVNTASVSTIVAHKYYFSFNFKVTNSNCTQVVVNIGGKSLTVLTTPVSNQQYTRSGIIEATSATLYQNFYHFYADAATASGKVMELSLPFIIDLTDIFGSGAEPTTEEFEEMLNGSWFTGTKNNLMPLNNIALNSVSGKLEVTKKADKSEIETRFKDFTRNITISGFGISTSATLSTTIAFGTAYVNGKRVTTVNFPRTYTASKDTYIDLDENGNFYFVEVANGATEPADTPNTLRIAKVVTNATAITNVVNFGLNTVFGYQALANPGQTKWNTAIGYQALQNNHADGVLTDNGLYNVAVGHAAMRNNTIGNHNTAVGFMAALYNTEGVFITAVGEEALYNNTTGNQNVAMGVHSLWNLTTGSYNVAIGDMTGSQDYQVVNDNKMTFVGTNSGVDKSVNTGTFENSAAIGYNARVDKSNIIQLGNVNVESVKTYGDFETRDIGDGFVCKSPDGSRWRITVSNTGQLITTKLT